MSFLFIKKKNVIKRITFFSAPFPKIYQKVLSIFYTQTAEVWNNHTEIIVSLLRRDCNNYSVQLKIELILQSRITVFLLVSRTWFSDRIHLQNFFFRLHLWKIAKDIFVNIFYYLIKNCWYTLYGAYSLPPSTSTPMPYLFVSIRAPYTGAMLGMALMGAGATFQSTHLREVRLRPKSRRVLRWCFNPRTYMRCDSMRKLSTWGSTSFNPRTYMRCDFLPA